MDVPDNLDGLLRLMRSTSEQPTAKPQSHLDPADEAYLQSLVDDIRTGGLYEGGRQALLACLDPDTNRMRFVVINTTTPQAINLLFRILQNINGVQP